MSHNICFSALYPHRELIYICTYIYNISMYILTCLCCVLGVLGDRGCRLIKIFALLQHYAVLSPPPPVFGILWQKKYFGLFYANVNNFAKLYQKLEDVKSEILINISLSVSLDFKHIQWSRNIFVCLHVTVSILISGKGTQSDPNNAGRNVYEKKR